MAQKYEERCSKCGSTKVAFGDTDLAFSRYCMTCKYNEILVDKTKNWSSVRSSIMSNLSMLDEADLSPEDFSH